MMYSAFLLLFCLAAAIAQEKPVGELKHVIVTYRAPQHTACDYIPDLIIAGKSESESELTTEGRKAAYYFGSEISRKYSPLLSVSDWDQDGWSFGTFTKRTQDAALIFNAGLKGNENDKFRDWTQEERDAIKYDEVKDFLKFQNTQECPGFLKSLKSVAGQAATLGQQNGAALQAVVQKYKADMKKPYQFWIAYETFLNQKAAGQLDKDMEAQLPGLKKFSEGLLFGSTSTDELKRKAGGRLLDNILKDLDAKKKGEELTNAASGKQNVKASFFAAPQDIVAAQLAVFNPQGTTYGKELLKPETFYPEQGAAHIVELHKMKSGSWNVRVLYRQREKDDFKAAVFPGCGGSLCDYDTFVSAVGKFRQTKDQLTADCSATQ